tara:strand:- start:122 stop:679 length:558 start_codon:yes stop_codon:yes gene_type:complete
MAKEKKYRIVNGKKVEDHSGLGIKKTLKILKGGASKLGNLVLRTEGIGEGKNQISKETIKKNKEKREQGNPPTIKKENTKQKTKKKKPLTRAAQMKADRAARKAAFDAHKKELKKKGQGKMTLKERQADDWKRAQAAAAKNHDKFQKEHKRGKYNPKNIKKKRDKEIRKQTEGKKGSRKMFFTTM